MGYELNADHVARAFAADSIQDHDGSVVMKVVEVGDLVVTSELVAASDPFVEFRPDPYLQNVPNGRHPVTLAIATYRDDERVAFARVRFSAVPVERWKMAVTRPATTLGPGDYFGYGVDSGTGCFMDPVAGQLLAKRCSTDERFLNKDMVELMDATYRHTRSWANVQPDPTREENVICFSSGVGDGSYPSFFGFDANGEVCQLVTDFGLFHEEPPEPPSAKRWWQFWK